MFNLGRASHPVQNFLHGTWVGHALHPLITDVPVGSWTTLEAQMLASTLGHHADEEEAVMFPQVESLDSAELDKQGSQLPELHRRLQHWLPTQMRTRIKREVLRRL
jgi:hypothetical protein